MLGGRLSSEAPTNTFYIQAHEPMLIVGVLDRVTDQVAQRLREAVGVGE